MLEWVRFALSAACTLFGLFVFITGVLGVYRFRTPLSRLHSAAISDTVGILVMLAGVIIAEGFGVPALKRALVIAFLWITSPVASHLIARLEVVDNDHLPEELEILDREAVEREREDD